MVSEVAHRAGYDLSQWQSIATLISDARKKLSGDEYLALYNAVTAYSRSRGSDAAALGVIESTLSDWTKKEVVAAVPKEIEATSDAEAAANNEADAVLATALQEASSTQEIPEPQKVALHEFVEPKMVTEETPQKVMTIDEAKARILVIKNEVHELIGNPVALIGDMGVLGKAYMSALLGASHATMGGASGGIMLAMHALESAYEKLRTVAVTDAENEQPEPVSLPVPVVVSEKPEVREEQEPEPEPVATEVITETTQEKQEEEILATHHEVTIPTVLIDDAYEDDHKEISEEVVKTAPIAALPDKVEIDPEITEEHIPEVLESVPVKQKTATAQEEQRLEVSQKEKKDEVATREADDEIEALRKQLALLELKLQEKAKAPEVELEPVVSVPDAIPVPKPVTEPVPLPREKPTGTVDIPSAPIQKAVVHTEQVKPREIWPVADIRRTTTATFVGNIEKEKVYQSEAVTDGLRSLLMSWEIFRGGFLSGKERGIDHPLYTTMHSTVMSDILAGKFQGARTSTVISVNDYVNAWRFEQGIEFNPAETFEHYLRRVIHRILVRAGELT